MIRNDRRHRERMNQAGYIPKPATTSFLYPQDGNPVQMGEHQMQKPKNKRNFKKKKLYFPASIAKALQMQGFFISLPSMVNTGSIPALALNQ